MQLTRDRYFRLKKLDEMLAKARDTKMMLSMNELCAGLGVGRHAVNGDLKLIQSVGAKLNIKKQAEQSFGQIRHINYYAYASDTKTLFTDISEEVKEALDKKVASLGKIGGNTIISVFNQISPHRNIVSTTKNSLENKVESTFERLRDFISKEEVIKLVVRHRVGKATREYTVSPWHLREYNRRWNLICYDHGSKRVLQFALDIIRNFYSVRSDKPKWKEALSINEIYKDIVGISIPATPACDIIFFADASQTNYIDTKPIHKSQEMLTPDEIVGLPERLKTKNGKFYKIHCKINYELIRDLMSYNSNLVVLSPSELVDDIKQKIKDMAEAYSLT